MKTILSVLVLLLSFAAPGSAQKHLKPGAERSADWPVYGGNKEGNRYSPLKQINARNIKHLQVAWEYDTSLPQNAGTGKGIQCQPIVVRGVLYGTTAELNLFALNAASGKVLWTFRSQPESAQFNTSRGVVYWESGADRRILFSSGSKLYAVNADTGAPVSSFGSNGVVDLHDGLAGYPGQDVSRMSVTATTPGIIYRNILIIGSSVTDSGEAAPGHIRGFDVLTGKLVWVFHTIPQPGEQGYETWPKDAWKHMGGANNWSGLSLDEKRGMVYLGTGSPSSDFYGGERKGANLFANCILALHAATGKLEWYYQTIHHDLWDRDLPCPPNLATIRYQGKLLDVVVQPNKDGLVYMLDRDRGTSVFPVEELPVPTAGLPGENPYPTQKFPVKPLPLSRQIITEKELSNLSPEANAFVKKRFAQIHSEEKFTPPRVSGTLLTGYSGGAEWGGNSIDPDGILYINANNDAWELEMQKDTGGASGYGVKLWKKFTDQQGYPGVKPPWGTLNAIDLKTGDYLWSVPLGEYPELTAKGVPVTGTENFGGPLATGSGLVFIAATRDEKLRAFDRKNGKVIWEYKLPAAGFATPVSYAVNGRQYIVIAAGGGRGLKTSGKYVAFALQ